MQLTCVPLFVTTVDVCFVDEDDTMGEQFEVLDMTDVLMDVALLFTVVTAFVGVEEDAIVTLANELTAGIELSCL